MCAVIIVDMIPCPLLMLRHDPYDFDAATFYEFPSASKILTRFPSESKHLKKRCSRGETRRMVAALPGAALDRGHAACPRDKCPCGDRHSNRYAGHSCPLHSGGRGGRPEW